jgi:hypothetical protein
MADTGSEWPETYHFIETVFEPWLKSVGHSGLVRVKAASSLEQHCLDKKIVPSRRQKWCTDWSKIQPIGRYLKANRLLPTVQYLGFHYDEALRRCRSSGRADIINEFPLVDLKINQQGCLDVIAAAGLPLPMKSGCFFCPEAKKGQIIELDARHPELFQRAVTMERNGSKFDKGFHLWSKKYPADEWLTNGRIRKPTNGGMGCAKGCFNGDMTSIQTGESNA